MAGYADTKKLIEDTLVGRPAGTMIYPEGHQAIDMSLLDYIHSVELLGASELQGIATTSTVPVQPDNAKVSYIATVPSGQTYVFTNFHDQNGNSISITTGANTVSLLTFLWNGEYWQVQNSQIQLMLNITAGYLYAGIAIPTTNPGSPDEPVFYIAAQAGTYTNFDSIVVNDGEAAILKYVNSSWVKEVSGLATREEVSRLACEVTTISNGGTYVAQYLTNFFADNYLFRGYNIVYTATEDNRWQGISVTINNPIIGKKICVDITRSGSYNNKPWHSSWFDANGVEHDKVFHDSGDTFIVPEGAVSVLIILIVAWDGGVYSAGTQCTFDNVNIYYKDIVNNLISNEASSALSAAMGKELKSLVDRVAVMIPSSDIIFDILGQGS